MTNATKFIAPHKAIQGAIARAYSINVMYRTPIRAPHATPDMPDNGTPDSRLRAIMAKLDVHSVHLPFQMGRQKRDLRILKANHAPRLRYDYRPAYTFEDGFTLPVCKGEVITFTGSCKPYTHVDDKAGIRRHREGY